MEEIGAILGIVLLGVGFIVACGYLVRDIFSRGRALQNSLKQELLLDIV